jgi:hypothetical protein
MLWSGFNRDKSHSRLRLTNAARMRSSRGRTADCGCRHSSATRRSADTSARHSRALGSPGAPELLPAKRSRRGQRGRCAIRPEAIGRQLSAEPVSGCQVHVRKPLALAADAVSYGISIAFSLTIGHSRCAFAPDGQGLPRANRTASRVETQDRLEGKIERCRCSGTPTSHC